ncbi:MAG: hypothetical protein ACXAEU_12065 [Candidatus Hodarchaeales archaeon]|jgi:hypothetical protein
MFLENRSIDIKINDSVRNPILIGLVILLVLSILGSFFFLLPANLEGSYLGHFIVPLVIASTIPIFVNYIYFVISRFGSTSNTNNSFIEKMSSIVTKYYLLGLIFHSVIYTIVIGLVFTHALLVIKQATYCLVLLFLFGIIWLIEYIFWFNNWPLYPKSNQEVISLYWLHWLLLFGTSIWVIFHAGVWFAYMFIPSLAIAVALVVILQDIRSIRRKTQISFILSVIAVTSGTMIWIMI